ncbi:3' terminal RNA ribose 2'-O-methyltransferase Hen1 [Spongiactinospora sp. TRM90649]|uniref:3' terminal RNA ribose 2'-O-methyltransferase Hen1 n=1 Tax=Spongiactinospora sp. TRM90649 TaxID=3031114 RepID=UPI0023F86700|nr:3' terminal RNA ribose 2'-O-methyltransferase Hen1 [Spongiactinospora sp. TRM90649]MDF5757934.1 3' terminal RNA ribose 2'-O-methyltransferase Hen1 [Spongiactinospora sp. TRM90649]
MLLTIATTAPPATDLGYLLHKHPDRVQTFARSFGEATVFYPEAGDDRCTAALLLDVDPVHLARTRGRSSPDFSLGQYVNDRPYAASSLLAVALADVFRTARAGRCDMRPQAAAGTLPLEIGLPALPCRGGPELAHRLFEPLGWRVEASPVPLDPGFPEWGDSRYVRLTLRGDVRLADALNHLYVLLPVLDDAKHYWIAADEVDKLIRAGEGWLAAHPARGLITRRYLGRRRALERTAFARLAELGDDVEETLDPPVEEEPEAAEAPEPKRPLNVLRREAVLAVLEETGARTVADLGCGSGELAAELLRRPAFTRIAAVDVSTRALSMAARRLRTDRAPDSQRGRLELFQGALTYADDRFTGFDAAVLMEVVEHVDPPRLAALERVVLGAARPGHVIVTTPNAEYNVRYEGLRGHRHPDHRFEWSRAEFAAWATAAAERYGYGVTFRPVGEEDPELGPPTQMAVFARAEARAVAGKGAGS